MTENIRRRSNTRARLIDAAEELVAETGILSFGIDAVCTRAGFTRGAFYSNFASISELLFALYERKTDHLLEAIRDADVSSPTEALDRLLDLIPADPQWYALRAVFALQESDASESLHEHAEELRRGLTPIVERLAEASGTILNDVAEATRVVIAAHIGAVLQGAFVEDPERLRRDTVAAAVRGQHVAAPGTLYALTTIPGAVHRIDLATGEATTLVDHLGEVPDGIVVDAERGEAIFTTMGAPDYVPETPGEEPPFTNSNGAIRAVSLAGGAARTLVETGSFTTGKQLTRDAGTGRLYWSDREGHGVYRAEADGSGVTALVLTAGSTPSEVEDQCVGVAIDPENGYLYWTQKGPAKGGKGRILRAALEIPEGSTAKSRDDVEVLWESLPEPIDLELDTVHGMMLWTDRGAEPDGNTLNRAPIPAAGEQGEVPQILARGFEEAIGLAVDHDRGLVYVSALGGSIREVSLATGVVRTVAELGLPITGIALG